VWDTTTGKLLFRLEGHANARSLLIAFSPDGKRIATTEIVGGIGPAGTGTIRLWDATTGRELLTLNHSFPRVTGLSFSPDGHRLLLQAPGSHGPSWDATPRAEAAQR
jgi:WD40 repeat protein